MGLGDVVGQWMLAENLPRDYSGSTMLNTFSINRCAGTRHIQEGRSDRLASLPSLLARFPATSFSTSPSAHTDIYGHRSDALIMSMHKHMHAEFTLSLIECVVGSLYVRSQTSS